MSQSTQMGTSPDQRPVPAAISSTYISPNTILQELQCREMCNQRRKINSEEKAKVVAAVGGITFILCIPCRASYLALGPFFNNSMNSSLSSNRPGAIHHILQFILVENSQRGNKFNKFCSPNGTVDLCLSFCTYSSMLVA